MPKTPSLLVSVVVVAVAAGLSTAIAIPALSTPTYHARTVTAAPVPDTAAAPAATFSEPSAVHDDLSRAFAAFRRPRAADRDDLSPDVAASARRVPFKPAADLS